MPTQHEVTADGSDGDDASASGNSTSSLSSASSSSDDGTAADQMDVCAHAVDPVESLVRAQMFDFEGDPIMCPTPDLESTLAALKVRNCRARRECPSTARPPRPRLLAHRAAS